VVKGHTLEGLARFWVPWKGAHGVVSIGLLHAKPYWQEFTQDSNLLPAHEARFWQPRSATGEDEDS